MKVDFKIHNRNHIIKNIFGNTEYLFTNSGLKKNELTVINYHGTQKKYLSNLKKQLNFFKKEFSIISPNQLDIFYSGHLVNEKPLLLFTFDDGIKNNLYAAELLNENNIKAYFFIVPEFIDTPLNRQKEYFINHIRPIINPHIDNKEEDFMALTWENIQALISQGHCIGSHTQTHTLIANKSTIENSTIEIIDSKNTIANKLKLPTSSINEFCSINNTLESIEKKELKLIKDNYNYHFTTIPGPNFSNSSPYFIKRANIESHWLLGAVKYAIGKWDLKRWKNAERAYLNLLKEFF